MIAPELPTHPVIIDFYERKPWWVFWRARRLVKSEDGECSCIMAPYYNSLAQEDAARGPAPTDGVVQ